MNAILKEQQKLPKLKWDRYGQLSDRKWQNKFSTKSKMFF